MIDNVLSPNASTASPNPKADVQGPVIGGSALPGGQAPFVTSSATMSALSTAVPSAVGPGQALTSTFAVEDIGKGAGQTTSSSLSASGAAASASATAKGGAVRGSGDGRVGGAMGLAGLLLGVL